MRRDLGGRTLGLGTASRRALAAIVTIASTTACSAAIAGTAASPQAPSTPTGQVPSAAVPLSDVLAAVGVSGKVTALPPDLTPPLTGMGADTGDVESGHCQAHQNETSVRDCLYGDKSGTHTAVIYGDSHAGMWVAGLDLAAKRAHWRLVPLGKPACPAPNLHFWDNADQRPNTECDTWHTWAVAKIASLHPDLIIVTSASFSATDSDKKPVTPEQWQTGLSQTLAALSGPGRRVAILGDIPYLSQPAPDCLAAHEQSVQSCSTSPSTAITAMNAVEKSVARTTGADYIDVQSWFCATTCSPVVGNMGVYHNRYHITATYSRFLSGVLQTALLPD